MLKYTGTKKVKVYGIPAPVFPGGTMITIGGCTGVFRSAGTLFYFDEIYPADEFSSKLMMHRVINVSKPGLYQKNKLRG